VFNLTFKKNKLVNKELGKIYDDEPDTTDLEGTNWLDRHLMIDNPRFQRFIVKFTIAVGIFTFIYLTAHLIIYSIGE